ncbi:response regulator transcription factor [Aureliella helgolandensis]|uniref:Oxygen regulatory protein NreC n=1 Tax=Aureliella helgolandensis TaxID=2527968 RepID=A0A518GB92_9BACT|nr:response regulator transcription factor [Aureliella helgolandensis]QDV25833.1 Oxygen regulatory protein NreC [Aureliella helgolandensis]
MTKTLSNTARIAVVDDHGIVRFGYSQLINQDPSLELCGMASNEREGLEMLGREQPDLAIADLSLREGGGMDLIQAALKKRRQLKILVISVHDESLFAHRVLALGARGFINKQEAPERLVEGIQTLLEGELYFSETVKKHWIRGLLGTSVPASLEGADSLSNRELQVFELIGNGYSTRQIADALYLSVKTIERHKENIKQKIGINHATQLTQHATQWVLQRWH